MKKRITAGQKPSHKCYEDMFGGFQALATTTGNCNLEESMWLFNWMQDKNIKNINPFLALLAHVKDDVTHYTHGVVDTVSIFLASGSNSLYTFLSFLETRQGSPVGNTPL